MKTKELKQWCKLVVCTTVQTLQEAVISKDTENQTTKHTHTLVIGHATFYCNTEVLWKYLFIIIYNTCCVYSTVVCGHS